MECIFTLKRNLLNYLLKFLDEPHQRVLNNSTKFKKARGELIIFNFLKHNEIEKLFIKDNCFPLNSLYQLFLFSQYLSMKFSLFEKEAMEQIYRYLDVYFPNDTVCKVKPCEIEYPNCFYDVLFRYQDRITVEIDIDSNEERAYFPKLPETMYCSIHVGNTMSFEKNLKPLYTQKVQLKEVEIRYSNINGETPISSVDSLVKWYECFPGSLIKLVLRMTFKGVKRGQIQMLKIIELNINSIRCIDFGQVLEFNTQKTEEHEEFFIRLIIFLMKFELNHEIEVKFFKFDELSKPFCLELKKLKKYLNDIKVTQISSLFQGKEESEILCEYKFNKQSFNFELKKINFLYFISPLQLQSLNYFHSIDLFISNELNGNCQRLFQFLTFQENLQEIRLFFLKKTNSILKNKNLLKSICNAISALKIKSLVLRDWPEDNFDVLVNLKKKIPLLNIDMINKGSTIFEEQSKTERKFHFKGEVCEGILQIAEIHAMHCPKASFSIIFKFFDENTKNINLGLWEKYKMIHPKIKKICWTGNMSDKSLMDLLPFSLLFSNVTAFKINKFRVYHPLGISKLINNFPKLENLHVISSTELEDSDGKMFLEVIRSYNIRKLAINSGEQIFKYILNSLRSKFRHLFLLKISSLKNISSPLNELLSQIKEVGRRFCLFRVAEQHNYRKNN